MSDTYRAEVSQVTNDGIHVVIPALGSGEYGPLEVVSHTRDVTVVFEVDDRVLVQQVGKLNEDFMVLGFIQRWEDPTP